MILMTITSNGLMVYMCVVGVLTHIVLIGIGMRKIKCLRSKSDKETQ